MNQALTSAAPHVTLSVLDDVNQEEDDDQTQHQDQTHHNVNPSVCT